MITNDNIINYQENWLQLYIDLILKGWARQYKNKNLNPSEYYESHHLIPRSWHKILGTDSEHPINRVKLEAREHFLAHYYLMKAFPNLDCTKHGALIVGHYLSKEIRNEKEIAEKYYEIRLNHSKAVSQRITKYNKQRKNKSYEDLYGPEKAIQLKADKKEHFDHIRKNRTKEEYDTWCNAISRRQKRNPNKNSKIIRCIELDLIFHTYAGAAEYFKMNSYSTISNAAQSSNLNQTAAGYHWEVYTKPVFEHQLPQNTIINKQLIKNRLSTFPVLCTELNLVFSNIYEAEKYMGVSCVSIRKSIRNNCKTSQGFHWEIHEGNILENQIPKFPLDRKFRNNNQLSKRPILCIELGISFLNARFAADYLGIRGYKLIRDAAAGKNKSAHGYHWKTYEFN